MIHCMSSCSSSRTSPKERVLKDLCSLSVAILFFLSYFQVSYFLLEFRTHGTGLGIDGEEDVVETEHLEVHGIAVPRGIGDSFGCV